MVQLSILNTLLVLYSLIASHPAIAVTEDQIHMTLNQDMISHGRVAWGTQLQIEGLSDWTNEQIVHLAGVAHQKMIKAHKANTWDRTQVKGKTTDGPPTVTTTLVFDNTAFIASSVKSPESFMYVTDGKNRFMELHADAPCNGAILTALNNCRTAQGFGHLTGAKCGEIWAAQGFCNTRTNRSLKGARIVAINMDKTDKQNPKPQVVDPCGSWGPDLPVKYPGAWGCKQFTEKLELDVIPKATAAEEKVVSDDDVGNSALLYS